MQWDRNDDWPPRPNDSGARLGSIIALILFIGFATGFLYVLGTPCPWLGQLCVISHPTATER